MESLDELWLNLSVFGVVSEPIGQVMMMMISKQKEKPQLHKCNTTILPCLRPHVNHTQSPLLPVPAFPTSCFRRHLLERSCSSSSVGKLAIIRRQKRVLRAQARARARARACQGGILQGASVISSQIDLKLVPSSQINSKFKSSTQDA